MTKPEAEDLTIIHQLYSPTTPSLLTKPPFRTKFCIIIILTTHPNVSVGSHSFATPLYTHLPELMHSLIIIPLTIIY